MKRQLGQLGAALASMVAVVAVFAPQATAAANGRIVFEGEKDAPAYYSNLFSVEPGASERLRLTPTHFNSGGFRLGSNPDVSPDGTRVVFSALTRESSYGVSAEWDLFVANADGSGVVRLTYTPAHNELKPAWSPDGTRIAYEAYAFANEIFVINADGSGRVQVTNTAERVSACGYPQQYTPDWLDVDTLVFGSDGLSAGSSCNRDLWTENVDGSGLAPLLVTPESWLGEFDPAVSADGSRIAFTRHNGIWTMRADGSDLRHVSSGAYDGRPAWSPDGTKIVFQSGRYVNGQAVGFQIWTMNADGSGAVPVTFGEGVTSGIANEAWDPTWAPAQDRTPPSISCGQPGATWQADNVRIPCTATDGGSGLADAADASFELATSVPWGTETAVAATSSRQVCDAAGNCATAGPFGGIKVDRKPPEVRLAAPAAKAYLLNASAAASYSCTDGGSGVASCAAPVAAGVPFDTASVGTKLFALAAFDGVGHSASTSVSYVVSYGVKLLYDPAKPTNRIRLQLVDANDVNVSDAGIALTALSIDGSVALNEAFSYVKHNDSYLYRLDSRLRLDSGMHTLRFGAAADPSDHEASFVVR